MQKGKFIVIEGADACGKSTHAKLLAEYLKKKGDDVVTTQEPTKGLIGHTIRTILSGEVKVSPAALTLLFTADRAEHVDNLLKPALEAGKTIISDRYYYSTVAYQSVQGVDEHWISDLNSFVPEPDLVIILEIKSEEAMARISDRRKEVFEVLHFQKKVQEKLMNMARSSGMGLSKPGKVWEIVINSDGVDEVQEKIRAVVDKHLK